MHAAANPAYGNIWGVGGITASHAAQTAACVTAPIPGRALVLLSENMLEGFAYCRMLFEDNRPQDFIYLHVNSSFEKLTGLEECCGEKSHRGDTRYQRSLIPSLLEIYGKVALTGQPEKFEIYLEPLSSWLSISALQQRKGILYCSI